MTEVDVCRGNQVPALTAIGNDAGYEHIHHGFAPGRLAELLSTSGFAVERCDVAARERRKPYFDVVCAFARRPDVAPSRAARTQRRAQ